MYQILYSQVLYNDIGTYHISSNMNQIKFHTIFILFYLTFYLLSKVSVVCVYYYRIFDYNLIVRTMNRIIPIIYCLTISLS